MDKNKEYALQELWSLVRNYLIADEPTSYLDRENADLVINLILDASSNFDLSTIIASHDISFKSNFDYSYTIEGKSLIKC